MEKRHDDLLTTRLETVIDSGLAYVLWNEIYRWYGVKKIAAVTYRDIKNRWEEISNGKLGDLKIIGLPYANGIYLMAGSYIKPLFEE